jgi:PAS domain S-box-containing protein
MRQEVRSSREYAVRSKGGGARTVSINSVRFPSTGKPGKLLYLFLDVTEQREITDRLRRSEERYRIIADNATDMIWTAEFGAWDEMPAGTTIELARVAQDRLSKWHFTYVSPSAKRVLGYDVEEMETMELPRLLTPASYRVACAVLAEELLAEHEHSSDLHRQRVLELEHVRGDNSVQWCEVTTKFLRGDKNQIVGVLGITRDITARKKAEQQLEVFRRFVEASGQGFGMADLDGRIIYGNPTIRRLCGVDRVEGALHQSFMSYHAEEDRRKLEEEVLPTVMRDGQWIGELTLASAKGESMPVIANYFLVRDEQDNPLCLATVLTDISERKKA